MPYHRIVVRLTVPLSVLPKRSAGPLPRIHHGILALHGAHSAFVHLFLLFCRLISHRDSPSADVLSVLGLGGELRLFSAALVPGSPFEEAFEEAQMRPSTGCLTN